MTAMERKRCGCLRGARRGDYDLSQCRLCWHEVNTPGWLDSVPVAEEDCCGGRRVPTVMGGPVTWACGVTTVSERKELLHRTLVSLGNGGFARPQVFVERGLGAFGTWWLALNELWSRNPHADRFAMFQDDLLCVRNLREYLDAVPHPERGYWNLFTTRENEDLVAGGEGWVESTVRKTTPHDPKCREQTGRGAVALVFPRRALVELLSSRHLVERPMDRPPNLAEGERAMADRNIDGGVVTAMNKAGYREYVHRPSLVQHVGDDSTISREVEAELRRKGIRRLRIAKSFPGENFDALTFLEKRV